MAKAKAMSRYCGAKTRAGGKCRRPAGWGTEHPRRGRCKMHGGSTPNQIKKAAREEALEQVVAWGAAVDIDPLDALLQCVQRTAGLVAYFNGRVAALKEEELVTDGNLALWVRMEAEATERLARFSKMALDAGVAERRVRMAERTGELIAGALEQALASVDLAPAVRAQIAQTFTTRLILLESGDTVEVQT
jgi:hypothetical protein